MFDLSDKIALVTGATGGIGFAIAENLHRQGAHVVLSGTRQIVLEEKAAALGNRVSIVFCNLGDSDAVDGLPKAAEATVGAPVDILINNAGITRDQMLIRMKDEDWDQVIAINLTSGFRLSRNLIRSMIRKRWGRIISISSIVGATGNPGQANYAAAKAGVVGFSKALAAEVASRGVTVNVVAPGLIATAMTDALPYEQKEKLLESIPAGRLGTTDDIAASVLYLASEEAGYVTGATIHVNGGMAML
ncbi:3-oxoacyl-(acyl-carrier-protein) reductase [Candidatus Endolissoclinum faulkneri L2]|uniref:3-oxoacyl-[acyl-carrier-protein] reductase n=1 Tax=Candidatus Endolissoclinum faulkneri L2 TaxID=1193729 RepID=K7YH43_9PROT|nr:3-oxoacyl-[acyl-carrier-protein] reductase [Candidatus Endolissoclinum faulkneri]AFX98875.1 3-oxoacyl-(acyl-carrier-protein) reductase [Candidatus Endolissoclinum faulkneri L2]